MSFIIINLETCRFYKRKNSCIYKTSKLVSKFVFTKIQQEHETPKIEKIKLEIKESIYNYLDVAPDFHVLL